MARSNIKVIQTKVNEISDYMLFLLARFDQELRIDRDHAS